MPIRTVGPTSTYPSIAAAMQVAGPGDSIVLEAGYGGETATVTRSGLTIDGGATSLGVVLQLGLGVAAVGLAGTAPIAILDALDANGIVGNAGDNLITVTGGADAVDGGAGTDRLVVDYRAAIGAITGDSTANFTEAGGGARSVTVTSGTIEHFTILTGAGADTITTGPGDDRIELGAGPNTATAGNGDNTVIGGADADTITTGDGNDLVEAGRGANTVSAGQGANTVLGGADADTITALDGGNRIDGGDGTNVLTSGDGADTILSGTGSDVIHAGGGADLVTLRGGADMVDAGAGDDRLVVDYAAMATAVSGGVTSGTLGSGYTGYFVDTVAATATFQAIENFTVTTGSGRDLIVTGDGSDVIQGGAGADTLAGGGGNDTVDGGLGADNLYGGDGNDSLVGGADNGTDILIAGAGNDTLDGAGGLGEQDFLDGGAGNDTYRVDSADDQVFEAAGGGTDTVIASASVYLYQDVEALVLAAGTTGYFGVGNDRDNSITGNAGANLLLGGGGNDAIDGGTGDDSLYGEAGNDTLSGGGGADALVGGTGNDTYFVDGMEDLIFESAGGGSEDFVNATVGAGPDNAYYLYAEIEGLRLLGSANAQGVGNGLDNFIQGNAGDNWLFGGAGNDTILTGGGSDVLFGEAGADTFTFRTATGATAILDFTHGEDIVRLDRIGFTSFAQVQAAMREVDGSTAIDLAPDYLLVLTGVANATLTESDFLFT
ncbi:beta strand repeat-containing protein [Paeniroseomonas aquatica]|uniref:Calcium-binding protein n=1 Tax=Paeniroseomonas aquatica TaxID=373043 RepID=A0ABT8AAH0_9PROT|nr:calcium-binding protein [Paeniroseomonas aquatica]MDN3566518.1 calcium-binding protein [Paeniroseomonas aquatica]